MVEYVFTESLIKSKTLTGADETAPSNVDLYIGYYNYVSISTSATTATTFHLLVSLDNSTYFPFKSGSDLSGTYIIAFPFIRVTWDAAGVSGTDTVDIAIAAFSTEDGTGW